MLFVWFTSIVHDEGFVITTILFALCFGYFFKFDFKSAASFNFTLFTVCAMEQLPLNGLCVCVCV